MRRLEHHEAVLRHPTRPVALVASRRRQRHLMPTRVKLPRELQRPPVVAMPAEGEVEEEEVHETI